MILNGIIDFVNSTRSGTSNFEKEAINIANVTKEAVKYLDALTNIDEAEKEVIKTQLQKASTSQLVNNAMDAGVSIINKTTAAQKALNMARAAGNVILTSLVSALLGAIATKAVSYFYDLANAESKVAEEAEKIVSTYKGLNDQFESAKDFVDDNGARYEELSKGVSRLGENISLTTEEYEEYQELTEQIAEQFPDLILGYDEEGRAIVSLKGNVEELTAAYKDLKSQANQEIINNLDTLIQDYQNKLHGGGEGSFLKDLFGTSQATTTDMIEVLEILSQANSPEEYKDILENQIRAQYHEVYNSDEMKALFEEVGFEHNLWSSISQEQLDEAKKNVQDFIDQLEYELETDETNIRLGFSAMFEESDAYDSLDKYAKSAGSIIINNLQQDITRDIDSESDVKKYVDGIIKVLEDSDVNNVITDLFTIDTNELDPVTAANQVKAYIQTVVDALAAEGIVEDSDTLMNAFGFGDLPELATRYTNIAQEATNKFGEVDGGWDSWMSSNSINSDEELDRFLEIVRAAEDAEDAQIRYLMSAKELFSDFDGTPLGERLVYLKDQFEAGEITYRDYFNGLNSEIENVDFKPFTDSLEEADAAAQQLFMDSTQQAATGLSGLINSFDSGNIGVTEYLEGYMPIANMVSTLTDNLQENSAAWNENGEALSETMNQELDAAQVQLNGAITTIESYMDSIYSSEMILSGAVEAGTDEFTAHVNVIAADLQRIVAEGGLMATEITNAMGTTTGEIASNMIDNVDNQSIAAQAIAANTNIAIADMAESVGTLFTTLGEQIKNFKVNLTFGIKKVEWSNMDFFGLVDLPVPQFDYEISATSNIQDTLGDALVNFGQQLSSNIKSQTIELPDFFNIADDDEEYVPSADTTANYKKALEDLQNDADSAKDQFEETFDYFERRVEVLGNAFDGLSASIENVLGAEAKNTLLSAQIGILNEEVNNYTDALEMYREKANEALSGLSQDIRDKIVDGAVAITDFIGDGNEEVVEAMNAYQDWASKVDECSLKLEELKTQLRELELEKFTNIVEDFTNQFELLGNALDLIDKQIGLLEEAGQLIGRDFYTTQIEQTEKQIEVLKNERDALVNQLNASLSSGAIQQGTEEWLEMVNTLTDLEGQILDCETSIESFNNSLLEIEWTVFERVQTEFGNINDELSNLVGLFDAANELGVSDGRGTWTNEAIATLGLYIQQYELAKYQVDQYTDAINKLNEQYKNGQYSAIEYMDKLAELNQGQWDAVNSANAMKDAIYELNETKINEEIETIEEEIEAYKEAVDAKIEEIEATEELRKKKDDLAEKTKSVTDIERQLAAMAYDDSAATIAKRQQLEEELVEAKKDLTDTEHEYEIEEQKNALNENYEAFEEAKELEIQMLEEKLKDREGLIAESFEIVKGNTQLVADQILMMAQEHGITVSDAIITPWQLGEDAIAGYGETLTAQSSLFIAQLGNVQNGIYALQMDADETAVKLADMYATKSDKLVESLLVAQTAEENLSAVTDALRENLINTLERGYDVSSILSSLSSIADGANGVRDAANSASSALSAMGARQDEVISKQNQIAANNAANALKDPIINQDSDIHNVLTDEGLKTGTEDTDDPWYIHNATDYSDTRQDLINAWDINTNSSFTNRDITTSELRGQNTYGNEENGDLLLSNRDKLNTVTGKTTTTKATTDSTSKKKSILADLLEGDLLTYAKGGIITEDEDNPLNAIAQAVGEDVLIAAKDQESVLTPLQTEGLLNIAPLLESIGEMQNVEGLFDPRNSISLDKYLNSRITTTPNIELNCDNLFEFNGDFNNSEELLEQMRSAGREGAKELLNSINRSFRYK